MSSRNKRMDVFARETFRLGCLQGFRHFSIELRGREELLLTVRRTPSSSGCSSTPSSPNVYGSSSARAGAGPVLVPMRESAGPLPPASPCDREKGGTSRWGETEAVFLIGGYAHYNCPYVWVRAGHSLIGSFGSDEQLDAPLQLQSTQVRVDCIASAPPPCPTPFMQRREPTDGRPICALAGVA